MNVFRAWAFAKLLAWRIPCKLTIWQQLWPNQIQIGHTGAWRAWSKDNSYNGGLCDGLSKPIFMVCTLDVIARGSLLMNLLRLWRWGVLCKNLKSLWDAKAQGIATYHSMHRRRQHEWDKETRSSLKILEVQMSDPGRSGHLPWKRLSTHPWQVETLRNRHKPSLFMGAPQGAKSLRSKSNAQQDTPDKVPGGCQFHTECRKRLHNQGLSQRATQEVSSPFHHPCPSTGPLFLPIVRPWS